MNFMTLGGEGCDKLRHQATDAAISAYGKALVSRNTIPASSFDYLCDIERKCLLEAREFLASVSTGSGWKSLPRSRDDSLGDEMENLHACLVLAHGVWSEEDGYGKKVMQRSTSLAYVMADEAGQYRYRRIVKTAEDAFESVGHRFAERDIERGLEGVRMVSDGGYTGINLGYVGDAVGCLQAVAMIRAGGGVSPLLHAVADPSSRRRDFGWRKPPFLMEINKGQSEALCRLEHNVEAITGPPGTGKSTLISALCLHCVPKDERTIVAAVQNKAIDSIAGKLATTASEMPFFVHGNSNRLSETSMHWTIDKQAEREPGYVELQRMALAAGMILRYLNSVWNGMLAKCFRRTTHVSARYRARVVELVELAERTGEFGFGFSRLPMTSRSMTSLNKAENMAAYKNHLLQLDPWKRAAKAVAAARFPVFKAVLDAFKEGHSSMQAKMPVVLQRMRELVGQRAGIVVCTCASIGGLLSYTDTPSLAQSAASECSTLVVDEAGTCSDGSIVPALVGYTLKRILLVGVRAMGLDSNCVGHWERGGVVGGGMVGGEWEVHRCLLRPDLDSCVCAANQDARQLPCFSRLKGEDAPVSLLERTDSAVGSTMLTTQYRMPEILCDVVSGLYYGGRLCTGKSDKSGEVSFFPVLGQAEKEDNGFSLYNEAEATKAVDLATEAGGDAAILCFYKAQVRLVKEMLPLGSSVQVMSVDASQGADNRLEPNRTTQNTA
jgi:predicted ATPase